MNNGQIDKSGTPVSIQLLRLTAAALALLAWAGAGVNAAESRIPEARFTETGADGCTRCHAAENMAIMAKTAHGDASNPHAPYAVHGCESCHGPGSLHVSRARGGAGFPPLLRFGRRGDPVARQLGACLACHANDMGDLPGMAWTGSLHDTGRMTCSSCHTLHAAENLLGDPAEQLTICATCHEQQIADHDHFEGKGIVFDRLTCHDCHDVHQLIGR